MSKQELARLEKKYGPLPEDDNDPLGDEMLQAIKDAGEERKRTGKVSTRRIDMTSDEPRSEMDKDQMEAIKRASKEIRARKELEAAEREVETKRKAYLEIKEKNERIKKGY